MIVCRRLFAWCSGSRGLLPTMGVAVLFGCSSPSVSAAQPTFGTQAFMTATGESGALEVEVRTSPQPPQRGIVFVELTVTRVVDRSLADGLTLQVKPFMPAHNHGSSVDISVIPEGRGKYLLIGVDLFMPGTWQLQIGFRGPAIDYVAPEFYVP
jgi:hypothetical protein